MTRESKPGWRRVELADGSRGWVAAAYLSPEPPIGEPATGSSPEAAGAGPPRASDPQGPGVERQPAPRAGEAEPKAPAAVFVRLEPFGAQPTSVDGELAVGRGVFRRRELLTGELVPTRATPIVVPRTRSWSVQIRWLVEDGTAVESGDALIEFDNSSLASRLEDSRISAVSAADALEQTRVETDRAAAEKSLALERAGTALDKARIDAELPAGLLSRREYQERQLQLRRAEVEYEKAQQDLLAQRTTTAAELDIKRIALAKQLAEIARLEKDLEALSPRAPESGLAVIESHPWENRKFTVGDTVWPGMTLLTLPDLASLQVEAELIDVDDGKIAVGMPAICRLDAYPAEAYACRVGAITPVAQATSSTSPRRSFKVRLQLERTDSRTMRPGMSVGVEVESLRVDDALMAPRAALDLATAPARVFLAGGGTAELELGPCNGLVCVVRDGIGEGRRLRAAAGQGP